MILPTRSMPTYTGTGRTSTYLREHHLRKAAKNNQKITSFFWPQAKPSNQFTSHYQITDIPLSPALTQSLSPSSNVTGLTGMMLTSESNTSSPSHNSEDESGTRMDVTQLALDLTSAELNHSGSGLADGDNIDADIPLTSFLDTTGDDEVTETNSKPVLETISRLMEEAKKYKSFTSMFYLDSLQRFITLWTKYQGNPKIKAPMLKASHVIAVSIGKGPYMARKIRALYQYISQFRTLPPISKGNHHAHPSLLNNERIASAVRRYLTVLANGEVSVGRGQYNQY